MLKLGLFLGVKGGGGDWERGGGGEHRRVKIDKAVARPHLGYTIARLIGAKGLRENDIRQPSRIDHLCGTKQPVLHDIPESGAAKPVQDRVRPHGCRSLSCRLEGGFELEGAVVFDFLADAGEEIVGRVRG